jgi:hypothetical protein
MWNVFITGNKFFFCVEKTHTKLSKVFYFMKRNSQHLKFIASLGNLQCVSVIVKEAWAQLIHNKSKKKLFSLNHLIQNSVWRPTEQNVSSMKIPYILFYYKWWKMAWTQTSFKEIWWNKQYFVSNIWNKSCTF